MSKAEMIIRNIWSSGSVYERHRIPGIIVTSKSTVIIYNEARRPAGDHGSDWALMDIFMQRSTDSGETFGERIYLAHGTEEHPTVNNPVMMEDQNGRLHLLYCRDYTIHNGGAWHRYSDDDGLTWSEAKEITYATKPELHNAFAFGPGHGICTANGRLLVPIWMVLKTENVPEYRHFPSVIHTFYSDDCGQSWQLGERIMTDEHVPNPNETVAAQLPDGRIMLNIRSNIERRSKAYSSTGIGDWTIPVPDEALPDPHCFGSMVGYHDLDGQFALLQVNCASETSRTNIMLKVSLDNGATWPIHRTIDAQRGGYSDIAVDENNRYIYVLYEEKAGLDVYLARLTPEWILK